MKNPRTVGVLSTLVVLATLATSAQARPDFSGRWTTDPDPALTAAAGGGGQAGPGRAAGAAGGAGPQRAGGAGPAQGRGGRGDMGSGWGSTITIAQDATRLTVDWVYFARGDMQPTLKLIYPLDGTETTNTVMMGRGMQAQKARTAWDGDKLVITTTHALTDPATGKPVQVEVKQILTLESPTSLVVETVRAGVLGAAATTSKSVYRKL